MQGAKRKLLSFVFKGKFHPEPCILISKINMYSSVASSVQFLMSFFLVFVVYFHVGSLCPKLLCAYLIAVHWETAIVKKHIIFCVNTFQSINTIALIILYIRVIAYLPCILGPACPVLLIRHWASLGKGSTCSFLFRKSDHDFFLFYSMLAITLFLRWHRLDAWLAKRPHQAIIN